MSEKQQKNIPQGKKQHPQGRTRQSPHDAKEHTDRKKNPSRGQSHNGEEALPNDEETTPTQPTINIIITPPSEQKKTQG